MNKYIIRNCPAFVLMRTATSGIYFNMCGIAKGHTHCKDNTDCLLKRIMERCSLFEFNYPVNQAIIMLTQNIKNMLEIEKADDQRLYDLQ